MLVIITGQEGSGKSVALEIINQLGYQAFDTDRWVKELYRYNEVGFRFINNKINSDFCTKSGVDLVQLNKWIQQGFRSNNKLSQNQNFIKLMNFLIPLIKKKMISLGKQYDYNNLIFVEFGDYFLYEGLFHDLPNAIIYITGRINYSTNSPYKEEFQHPFSLVKNRYYHIDNNGSITLLKENVRKTVNQVIEDHLNQKFKMSSKSE